MRSLRSNGSAMLLIGTSALAFAFTAHAADDVLEEIVVTGSRVITNGNESPSPVTMVQTEDLLQVAPGNLAEALNSMPVFAGSRGTTSSPVVQGSQGGGSPSANVLNLRNLGTQRTLVLMDGYRVPPSTFNSAVDVDIIPQMLVSRVDTVTGGVSAVYGSDAVAGVVNYILDKKFDGIRVEGSWGQADRKDAKKWDIGVAAGMSLFNDRGHLEGSFQHLDNSGILAKSDRPYIWGAAVSGTGTQASPYTLQNNAIVANTSRNGRIVNTAAANQPQSPFTGQTFNADGSLRAYNAATDGTRYDTSLLAPTKQNQLFVRYDHELTDNLNVYVQVAGELKKDEVYGDNLFETVNLSTTNPYLAQSTINAYAALNPVPSTFRMSVLMDNFSRFHSLMDSSQWIYAVGLDGKFGDYKWGFNYNHSNAKVDNHMDGSLNYQNWYAALDAVNVGGNIVCRASTISAAYANCVPINLFGGTPSAAAMAYVAPSTDWSGTTKQDDIAASITGAPFSTWAGEVGMALSGEWRKLSFSETSTADALARVDCTSIRGTGAAFAASNANCALDATIPGNTTVSSQGLWKYPFPASDTLSQSVSEVALEADFPLLKDAAFIQSMNVNTAVRYTSYSLSGDYTTWKVGTDIHFNDTLRFRATASEDIRAPTLYELYVPASSTPVSRRDRLTGATPTVPSRDLGNLDLTAEVGHTITAGFVLNATPDLSFALDGYRIQIDRAIQLIQGTSNENQDACYASAGTSALCALQDRPLGNVPSSYDPNNSAATATSNTYTAIYSKYFNIASIKTYGADLEINYKTRIADRPFNFRLLTAYQPHTIFKTEFPGTPTSIVDQGGAGFGGTGFAPGPVVRLTGMVHAQVFDNFSVDLMERYRSSLKLDGTDGVYFANDVPSYYTTNVTLTYDWATTALSKAQFYFNVSNLFDAKAPFGSSTANGARPGLRDGFVPGDDVVGLAYTLGFRLKM